MVMSLVTPFLTHGPLSILLLVVSIVRIHGLLSQPSLNGRVGHIVSADSAANGRVRILLDAVPGDIFPQVIKEPACHIRVKATNVSLAE